jgi:ABC-type Mn2+/Zn2+ transport system permease subunit
MLVIAVVAAVAATVMGTVLATWVHKETGPLVVTVAAGLFLLSLSYSRS